MDRGIEQVGLCFTCVHSRRVPTPRATFWLCGLSASDPRFERYPRLPVSSCDGWQPVTGNGDEPDTG